MIGNYLKVVFRLLLRNPYFTLINFFGLSIGIAAFLVLWQYSQTELNSDRFHNDHQSIYRMGLVARWTDNKKDWEEVSFGNFHPALAAKMKNEYDEIEDLTRIFIQKLFHPDFIPDHGNEIYFEHITRQGQRISFQESNLVYADPNLFDFFKIELVKGDEASSLNSANALIISESQAKKYFGKEDPIGKTLQLNGRILLEIRGVFKDLPRNTHLNFNMAISTERIKKNLRDLNNNWWGPKCYFRIKDGVDMKEFENKVNKLSREDIRLTAFAEWPYGENEIYIQPIEQVPFTSYRWDFYQSKSRYFLVALRIAALVILSMAWINYINLKITLNSKRMTEIAVRKTTGAFAGDFVMQFVVEAVIVNVLAVLMGLTLIQLFKVPARTFLHFYLPDLVGFSLTNIGIVAFILLLGVIIISVYPAINALKQTTDYLLKHSKSGYRKHDIVSLLTIFQFMAAIVLITWMFSMYLQINHLLTRDIGFNRDEMLIIDLPVDTVGNTLNNLEVFSQELSEMSNVNGFTFSYSVPGNSDQILINMAPSSNDPGIEVESDGGVDENFVPLYGIQLIAGRNFISENVDDRRSILLSKSGALRLGFQDPDDIIGLKIQAGLLNHQVPDVTVIGVFNDYKIRPLLNEGYNVTYGGDPGLGLTYKDYLLKRIFPKKLTLKIEPGNFSETLSVIEKKYMGLFPGSIFNWYFLDDIIQGQYQNDKIARNQILFFTFLAIIIACLGLLGMISFRVVEKTKEIGIRKVMGANLSGIFYVLLKSTLRQIIIAAIVATPLTFFIVQKYLEKYSERIQLQWWHYLIPIMLLFIIFLSTTLIILHKTARQNPVDSLRYE